MTLVSRFVAIIWENSLNFIKLDHEQAIAIQAQSALAPIYFAQKIYIYRVFQNG